MKGDFLTGAASVALSLAVNATAFYAVDHAELFSFPGFSQASRRPAPARSEDVVQFQFVEAPPKAHPRKPKNTPKIAARDALNQDAARSGASDAAARPAIETEGVSDQLAQSRAGSRAAEAVPQASAPRAETPAAPKANAGLPDDPLAPRTEPSPADFPAPTPEKASPAPSPQAASAPSPGLTGRDRINTEEMTRSKSNGAALFGVTSFEATGSGMGEYMKNLKEKIWLAWFPYIAFKYPTDFKTADAVVGITLDRDGRVALVKVLETQGSEVFASFCVRAVQEASPFGPLPPEILALVGKDELEIKFGFHYH